MTGDDRTHDAIVIGGGVAGLTAALHLAERGLHPLVLEAADRVGGRLAGRDEITVNGWHFPAEHGVHGIWSRYLNFKSMLSRHGLLQALLPAREELWIYGAGSFVNRAPIGSSIRNSLFPPPFHYLQLFLRPEFLWALDLRDWAALFNIWPVLLMGLGIDPFVEDQPLEGRMLGEALQRWSPALRSLFSGLTRNALSMHPDEIPLAGFLGFLRFYTLLRRKDWAFSYLPNGGGEICRQLSERLVELGGEVRCGTRAARLEQTSGWRVHWEQNGNVDSQCSPCVILALDSPATASLLKSSFPAESASLFFPRAVASAIIRLWFDRPPRRSPEAGIFSGDFIMHNFFWLDQIHETYRRWNQETGGACIEVHVYGPPEVLQQADAVLVTNVLTGFYRAYPELKGHLILPHIQRNPATHTLPSLGPRGAHPGVETQWPDLFCAGDWVRHPTPAFFLERACVTGIEAGNRVLLKRGLETWGLEAYPPPEALAGWIEKLMRRGRQQRREKRSRLQ